MEDNNIPRESRSNGMVSLDTKSNKESPRLDSLSDDNRMQSSEIENGVENSSESECDIEFEFEEDSELEDEEEEIENSYDKESDDKEGEEMENKGIDGYWCKSSNERIKKSGDAINNASATDSNENNAPMNSFQAAVAPNPDSNERQHRGGKKSDDGKDGIEIDNNNNKSSNKIDGNNGNINDPDSSGGTTTIGETGTRENDNNKIISTMMMSESPDIGVDSSGLAEPLRAGKGIKLVTAEEVQGLMESEIQRANAVMFMERRVVKLLLARCGWDVGRLLEKFFVEDRDTLLLEAGIDPTTDNDDGLLNNENTDNDGTPSRKKQRLASDNKSDTPEAGTAPACMICFDDSDAEQMCALGCGHRYCADCWKQYLYHKIVDDGESDTITCPGFKCPVIVDDATILRFISDDAKAKRLYSRLCVESFVNSSKNLTWCPAPGCIYAIQSDSCEPRDIICACGHTFCFECGEPPHRPADCVMIREWKKKLISTEESDKWIRSFTKPCPKCNTPIIKDGGCQYVACLNRACRHRFCWMCLGAFDHTDHNCNSLAPRGDDDDAERYELNKFLHFHNHFLAHRDSLETLDAVRERALLLKREFSVRFPFVDSSFFIRAVNELVTARRVLMNSYIYGFYLPSGISRGIFEHLQSGLASAVEVLHAILENSGSPGLGDSISSPGGKGASKSGGKKNKRARPKVKTVTSDVFKDHGIEALSLSTDDIRAKIVELTSNLSNRLRHFIEGLANEDIVGESGNEKVQYRDQVQVSSGFYYYRNK